MKAIKTIFVPATNTRGSRVKATDCDHNNIVLSWEHELASEENHIRAAYALRDKMRWTGKLVTGGLRDCYVHVFLTKKGAP
jgi:hypothetical protein